MERRDGGEETREPGKEEGRGGWGGGECMKMNEKHWEEGDRG